MSRPASDPADDLIIRRLEWEPDAQLSSRTWAYTATWKGRPVAIQAIVFRPDRSALFLTPDFQQPDEEIEVSRHAILKAFAAQVDQDLRPLDLCFLQSVTEQNDALGVEALHLNQFQSVTDVREMRLELPGPGEASHAEAVVPFDFIAPPLPDPRWRAAFAGSTGDQLDVPELLSLRTTDESFESLCLLAKGDTDHWRLAVRNDEPIGLILPTPIPDGTWEIQYVGVSDACRRQGIGRDLLTWGIEVARTEGATALSAQVDARNGPAFALYRSLGFHWQTTRTLWLRSMSFRTFSMMTTIRLERPGDEQGIRTVHEAAFPTPAEATLVDALRASGRLLLSMAAEQGSRIVGHLAFSPVTTTAASGWGLAPVAVLPEFQRQGIASRLIRDALASCESRQVPFVVVLGDPQFYSRFRFEPAPRCGLTDEYGGSEAFQIWAPRPELIPRDQGLVRYAPEFGMFADDPEA